MRNLVRVVLAIEAFMLAAAPALTCAAELQVLSTVALQSVVEDVAPKFEAASGHKLKVVFGVGVPLAKRVQDGEAADLYLGPRGSIDSLIKAAKVVPNSDVTLARSSVGVAIRRGTPKPDISNADALKRALLSAKGISYSNPAFGGTSGVHFAKVLERLGIAEEMKVKTKFPPEGGLTARFLASGEADIAIQQVGELISVPEAEVIGTLPGDLNSVTTFAAVIPLAARQADAARAFIRYLQSPDAASVMKTKGLDLPQP